MLERSRAGPPSTYALDWEAAGAGFFDKFDFNTVDMNFGAAQYLDHSRSLEAGVVELHDTHAILRTGARVRNTTKRESINIRSKKGWRHFLMLVRFSHLPVGCGLWPALWTLGLGREWPLGGELDILEWTHDFPQQVSFHVGSGNKCDLDSELVNAYGPMKDLNKMNNSCVTDYSKGRLGCAPNKMPPMSPEQLSSMGGMLAIESTASHVKVFHIPAAELPDDIDGPAPNPEEWDKWVISYYPFALSEAKHPGTCPQPEKILSEQHLILNINMCGEWGSPMWQYSSSCLNKRGPVYPGECKIVSPITQPKDLPQDCCTKFIMDDDGTYGTESYLREHAYFNISWVRVYQHQAETAASTLIV